MSDKNNHYYVGGKLYIIPKIIADVVEKNENRLSKERDQLKAKNERLLEALELLRNWTKAYPLDMFPEPDLKLARKLLTDGGVSYDALNAYSMRHVINGVAKIIDEAIKCEE